MLDLGARWTFGYKTPLTRFAKGQNKKSVSTFGGVCHVSKRLQLDVAALLAYLHQNLSKRQ